MVFSFIATYTKMHLKVYLYKELKVNVSRAILGHSVYANTSSVSRPSVSSVVWKISYAH